MNDLEKLGVQFIGMQERVGKLPLPLYTDLKTGSSFLVSEGQTVAGALAELRTAYDQVQKQKEVPLYKLSPDGTCYSVHTPDKVIEILEAARKNGTRIRLFYGDRKTGKDWLEEMGMIGYIGRSTGVVKVPLLLHTWRSSGGGHILDQWIVKITIDKRCVYQHPGYHQIFNEDHLGPKADRLVAFLRGERNSK